MKRSFTLLFAAILSAFVLTGCQTGLPSASSQPAGTTASSALTTEPSEFSGTATGSATDATASAPAQTAGVPTSPGTGQPADPAPSGGGTMTTTTASSTAVTEPTAVPDTVSNSKVVTIDLENVVNSQFIGNGSNLMPHTAFDSRYTDALYELDAKRIRMMQPRVVRVWVQVDWMVTAENSEANYNAGVYDFNTPKMQALYKYLDVFQDAGTEIQLTYGWKVGSEIQSWYAFPGFGETSAPLDVDKYAQACSSLLRHLRDVKGYTNVKHVTFANEPNGSWDFECPGDQKAYYVKIVKAVDTRLKADGLRGEVKIWACESAESPDWLQYMTDHAGDCVDVYSYHDYNSSNTVIGNVTRSISGLSGKPLMISECGYADDNFLKSVAGYAIANANSGGGGVMNWTLVGANYVEGSSSYDYVGDSNLWNSLLSTAANGLTPNKSYYIQSLLTRYIAPGSKVVSADAAGGGIRAAAFVAPDGNITVLVEMEASTEKRDITFAFSSAVNKTFGKHFTAPATQELEANALIPVRSASFQCGSSFQDTSVDAGYHVAVYTTQAPQAQVALDKVMTTAAKGSTVQIKADVIDGGDQEVVWSIAAGADMASVDGSGRVTIRSDAAAGTQIAVKAALADAAAYAVSVITVQ